MKTGIEIIASVKVKPRTEPLTGGAIMIRVFSAALAASLSKDKDGIDYAIDALAESGAEIAAEIDRLNKLKAK